jgi:hypothetical protein
MLLSQTNQAKRRVRSAVKVTRKAINRALDAAEPRLETAAVGVSDFGRDAYRAVQKGSRQGLIDLKSNYGKLERKVRRRVAPPRTVSAGKLVLVAAGVAVIAASLLRRH